jgi:hypothetical protein
MAPALAAVFSLVAARRSTCSRKVALISRDCESARSEAPASASACSRTADSTICTRLDSSEVTRSSPSAWRRKPAITCMARVAA